MGSRTLSDVNPLRYRGYYYDSETGFYYLQSRYYDPAIGRFINADSYASTDATGLLSTNMFAYCENDPINRSDPSGEDWQETAKIGLMIAGVGLMALAVISTGGGALVFAGAGISVSAASATLTMATVTVSIGTAITGLSIIRAVNDNNDNGNSGDRTSAHQMNQQVRKGQAPKSIDRVDKGNPRIPGNKDHVHFKDGTALNYDGSISHEGNGVPQMTRSIRFWLIRNGWKLPRCG